MKDRAVDMPKIEFSANKILAEHFFNNPSDGNLDHPTTLLSVMLRSAKSQWRIQGGCSGCSSTPLRLRNAIN